MAETQALVECCDVNVLDLGASDRPGNCLGLTDE